MASSRTNTHTDRAPSTPAVPPVESFTNQSGEIQMNLSRVQWLNIVGALSIAAGTCASNREYEQMFFYGAVAQLIGQRLGLGVQNQQVSGIGESPPGGRVNAASA